jgi:8-oxo-dGTP diphosphatase
LSASPPTPRPDALDARFVDRAAMAALPLVDGLLDALAEWDALPRT